MRASQFGKCLILFACPALMFYNVNPVFSYLSSGGEYGLESSVVGSSGGQLSSGGEYTAKGALSQSYLPVDNESVKGGEYVNRTGFYNPPYFTYQRGLPVQLSLDSGSVELFLPANSIEKNSFDITINKDVTTNPIVADSSKITDANLKMEINEGSWAKLYASNISEMVIFDEQDFLTGALPAEGTLSMGYNDVNDDGILDGSNPQVRIDTLQPWILDSDSSRWVKMPGAYFDLVANKIVAPLNSMGVYSLLGMLSTDVSSMKAFPVPFRPNGPNPGTGPGQTGTAAAGITFTSVPQNGDIQIYTIDGRLVKKIDIASNMVSNEVPWNVKTDSGQKVASGVYIWRVVSGANSKTGKLMIIW